MNEQEFRHALHDTMTAVAEPPPMSETPVLDAARRAQRRRKARWAGAGSAAAVAVVALAAVVLGGNSGDDAPGGGVQVGGSVTPTASAGGETKDTESWPNGQTDRTARSGPRFDQGEALLGEVTAVVPAGFGAPDDLVYLDPAYSGGPLRRSQAQYRDTVDGVEVWEYQGEQPVTKDGGVGRMFVEVTSPGSGITGDGCDLAPTLWGLEGTCQEKVVDGKRVGVFTATGGRRDFETWAGYRHTDGTVVFVAQSLDYPGSAMPALTSAPLSTDRLAELAVDPRFPRD